MVEGWGVAGPRTLTLSLTPTLTRTLSQSLPRAPTQPPAPALARWRGSPDDAGQDGAHVIELSEQSRLDVRDVTERLRDIDARARLPRAAEGSAIPRVSRPAGRAAGSRSTRRASIGRIAARAWGWARRETLGVMRPASPPASGRRTLQVCLAARFDLPSSCPSRSAPPRSRAAAAMTPAVEAPLSE
jgi:hypothetical protein